MYGARTERAINHDEKEKRNEEKERERKREIVFLREADESARPFSARFRATTVEISQNRAVRFSSREDEEEEIEEEKEVDTDEN